MTIPPWLLSLGFAFLACFLVSSSNAAPPSAPSSPGGSGGSPGGSGGPVSSPGSGPGTPSPAGTTAAPQTHYFNWTVAYTNYTRLCHTKALVAVNGQYPGPTVFVNEGDTVIVNVTNLVDYNMTIHWHGVRQFLTGWSDGPAYITQCPIQTGKSFVHNFTIVDQRGTLLWHAHISWQRATVHGAFIMQPKGGAQFPFTAAGSDITIVLGEWWNVPVESIIEQALATGAAYNISDALTINGQPGALYPCSVNDTTTFDVDANTTYRLRIINAAVNFLLYVGVTNHTLTTVEVDAEYTQSLTTDFIMLAPGQTTTVLLTTDQPAGQYFLAASVFSPPNTTLVPYPTIPTTAVFQYSGANLVANISDLPLPNLPLANDTAAVANYTQSLRGENYTRGFYYYSVPMKLDYDMLVTVGYALQPCSNCSNPAFPTQRFAASMSNITFQNPPIALLQAYYESISGDYEGDFPDLPYYQYNYTGVNPDDKTSLVATKVKVLEFGQSVQIVFQDTATLFFESHPIHLHGQNFYIVGTGFGTFDNETDPASFNLVDPPSRNTVAVPTGGWAAVRFTTTNPGVWFMHCHIDLHVSWGMMTAFIVKNGNGTLQTLPPPPADLPPC